MAIAGTMKMKTAIVIPARYASTRFPGKPLEKINGKTMLARVVSVARIAASKFRNVDLMVATDDKRIAAYCKTITVPCVMTSPGCRTGSDRALQAVKKSGTKYDFIVNFQGDAPFTDPAILAALIKAMNKSRGAIEVVTPVHRLDWSDLDRLRAAKKKTPFSGTTVTRRKDGFALWFSKQVLPAIRKEDEKRGNGLGPSPVFQHIGIYGFSRKALERFVKLPPSHYEELEGLEQLRLLENGISVLTVEVKPGDATLKKLQGGIDSPGDAARVEKILKKEGEPYWER